jgi:pimeloyl-ACP methyl ester carboxylesterase
VGLGPAGTPTVCHSANLDVPGGHVEALECATSRDGLRFYHRIIPHPKPEFLPVLFVSGAFQTMDSWARFARVFARHTTVLLVDPPGMGHSGVLPPSHGVDFLAGCLKQVLEERGIDRANMVAASYGTPSAFRMAQLYPASVARVVMGGTMRELPVHLRKRIADTIAMACRGDRDLMASKIVEGMLCHERDKAIDRRELAARVLGGGIRRMSEMELLQYAANTQRLLDHEPLDLNLPISGPEGLVFTGEHDVFTTPDHCQDIAGAFDRAWLTTIQRADHLFHIEQFDTVVELLLRFMRGRVQEGIAGCNALTPVGRLSVSAEGRVYVGD